MRASIRCLVIYPIEIPHVSSFPDRAHDMETSKRMSERTMLLHDPEEPDDDLGRRPDQDLALASPLGVVDRDESVVKNRSASHLDGSESRRFSNRRFSVDVRYLINESAKHHGKKNPSHTPSIGTGRIFPSAVHVSHLALEPERVPFPPPRRKGSSARVVDEVRSCQPIHSAGDGLPRARENISSKGKELQHVHTSMDAAMQRVVEIEEDLDGWCCTIFRDEFWEGSFFLPWCGR